MNILVSNRLVRDNGKETMRNLRLGRVVGCPHLIHVSDVYAPRLEYKSGVQLGWDSKRALVSNMYLFTWSK